MNGTPLTFSSVAVEKGTKQTSPSRRATGAQIRWPDAIGCQHLASPAYINGAAGHFSITATSQRRALPELPRRNLDARALFGM